MRTIIMINDSPKWIVPKNTSDEHIKDLVQRLNLGASEGFYIHSKEVESLLWNDDKKRLECPNEIKP